MRAIDAVLGQPWAIMPGWLEMIAAIAQRQHDAPVVAAMQQNLPRAAEAGVRIENGIAVMGIIGPIFPRANMMTEMSGATSLAKLQGQFRAALADGDVSAIILHIDSPGGVTTGIGDFAAEIRAARAIKPIVAVAAGSMASAAYEIGAAASTVVASPTAVIGSIGVVAGLSKQVQPDAKGSVSIEIVSSNAPNKRPDPTDSAGRAQLQELVDSIEAEMLASVAASRGVSVDKVKADFGQGGVLVGAKALAAGLIDRLGTLDSVLTGLAAASPVTSMRTRAAAAASSEHDIMTTISSVAALTAAYPDLVAQIRQEAVAGASTTATDAALAAARLEGGAAERERILAIEAHALPGHEKLIAECKADPTCTADQAAARILGAEKKARGSQLAGIAGVELLTGAVGAAPAAQRRESGITQPPQPGAVRPLEAYKADWEKDTNLQADFATADAYANYAKGVAEGRIRVLNAPATVKAG